MPKPLEHEAGNRDSDRRRGSARERGYNTRWDKARKIYLQHNPLCVMCQKEGRVTPATVVDHIKPHKGDTALFWDIEDNWQSLCAPHHNRDKQREERGRIQALGEDGWPIYS
ncbi:HNH endonuclease [Microvirga lenta]|uniref:HNH endonuclease n=1 Tax=Microvirga lenta TaxID=2881337 RepID=UPI001CFD97D7|nr:HNH endonuclease signature motif containing protein [Microvirga lenta]MCB5173657.1 HNH endonuclease [Microvirga lenta]